MDFGFLDCSLFSFIIFIIVERGLECGMDFGFLDCSLFTVFTVNARTPSFFLKRHLFYVPYISGHVPNRVFLLFINVRTQKNMPLIFHKTSIFTTAIFCIFALFTCVSG